MTLQPVPPPPPSGSHSWGPVWWAATRQGASRFISEAPWAFPWRAREGLMRKSGLWWLMRAGWVADAQLSWARAVAGMAVLVLSSWNLLRTHIQNKLHVASSVGSWFFIYSLCFFVSTKKGRSPLRPVDAGWAWSERAIITDTHHKRSGSRCSGLLSNGGKCARGGASEAFYTAPPTPCVTHTTVGVDCGCGRWRFSAQGWRSTEPCGGPALRLVISRGIECPFFRVPRPRAAYHRLLPASGKQRVHTWVRSQLGWVTVSSR